MITKRDILIKCQPIPELHPISFMVAQGEFSEDHLEAIDFTISLFITLRESYIALQEITLAKLETWLTSIKDIG